MSDVSKILQILLYIVYKLTCHQLKKKIKHLFIDCWNTSIIFIITLVCKNYILKFEYFLGILEIQWMIPVPLTFTVRFTY